MADLGTGFTRLEDPMHHALGAGNAPPSFEVRVVSLESTDRVVVVTDGIIERTVEVGGRFGVEGVRRAIQAADGPPPLPLPLPSTAP